jgi:hypothetical protein
MDAAEAKLTLDRFFDRYSGLRQCMPHTRTRASFVCRITMGAGGMVDGRAHFSLPLSLLDLRPA